MLVITRDRQESIYLTLANGDVIRVVLVETRGRKARIGIAAPESVGISRHEPASVKKAALPDGADTRKAGA